MAEAGAVSTVTIAGRREAAGDGVDRAMEGPGRIGPGAWSRRDFAERTRELLPSLYRLARRLVAEPADAEDLVQDTYLKAYQAFDRATVGSADDVRAWLTRILVNAYRDQYRRRMRSPIVTIVPRDGEGPDPIELAASREPGPIQQIEGKRFAEAAQAAIVALPPELRLAISLFLLEGLSYEQIAERTAVPAGTVMSRLWRARRLLRQALRAHLSVTSTARARRDNGNGARP